jgi:hypothetical protein
MILSKGCLIILDIITERSIGPGVTILSSGAVNTQCLIKACTMRSIFCRSALLMTQVWEQTHDPRPRGRAICRNPRLIKGAAVDQSP